MPGTGTSVIDSGAFPGSNEASVSITVLTGIGESAYCEAWLSGEASTEHTQMDHRFASPIVGLVCDNVVAGTETLTETLLKPQNPLS